MGIGDHPTSINLRVPSFLGMTGKREVCEGFLRLVTSETCDHPTSINLRVPSFLGMTGKKEGLRGTGSDLKPDLILTL